MNNLEKSRTQRIVDLHNEITNHLKMSLQKAIEVGKLLTEQKQSLNHGEFTPWITANLPFTDRTARNYMRLFLERDRLKTESVSDLKSAYQLLTEPKTDNPEEGRLIDMSPEELRQFVSTVNEYIGNKTHFISTDETWWHKMVQRLGDDGSMSAKQMISYSLAFNIHKHECYFRQYAWHKGIRAVHNLPVKLKQYLKEIGADLEECARKEPPRLCRNRCQVLIPG